ncbi:unnamed protein product [Durusdinium trenchii]|uniref:3-oxo-5-alpha-steroid 4-dehydrogenase C-terminal domain-containing protein n=2 Tax=Durusdinium trenchii TaxID=1381693 RepID=A0ABP0MEL2_9DINO
MRRRSAAQDEAPEAKLEAERWRHLALVRISPSTNFNLLCTWAALLVLITGLAECSSSTAYGKFGNESLFSVPPRVGWWLMELPVTISFLYSFFYLPGPQKQALAPRICAAVMCLHYSYRGWIYPYLLRPHPGARSNFSLMPALGGWLVTITHGYLNGRWFAEFGLHLGRKKWLSDVRFLLGLLLYFSGFIALVYHDYLMRELRSSPGPRYRIPHGGLFDYATQAVYFCELWTWLGFFLMSWGPNGLFIFLVSCANLIPRSVASHQWYVKTFGQEYEQLQRAFLVPFIW